MYTYSTYLLAIILSVSIPIIILILGKKKGSRISPIQTTPNDVAFFYNNTTEKFLQVYGEIIQAFRTNNIEDYLDYTIRNAELEDGQKILDAGCGVGGPASYFASKLKIEIKGITISDVQVEKSKAIIASKSLLGTVKIIHGDYHNMEAMFGTEVFDRVLFLESFGHSTTQINLIEKAFSVLKPGGILYIKDLFKREYPNAQDGKKIDAIIDAINKSYCYNVANLNEVLSTIRRIGFIILFVKTPEIEIGEFEHLTISNDFQELFDIAKIISWEDYFFPIDFYEIKVMKPPFDNATQKHLYFLNRPELKSKAQL